MGIRAGVLVSVAAFTLAGCAAEAPDPAPNLFAEYTYPGHVENDRYATAGARMAAFAGRYSAEELAARLFHTFECGEPRASDDGFDTSCDFGPAVAEAVRDAGGDEHDVTARVIIVKRADERLELLTLYVEGGTLIDGTGEAHHDLEEFLADNDLLSHDDVIMAPEDITGVPGEGRLVTVHGHTAPVWQWWVLGAISVVVLLSGGAYLRQQMRP